MVRSHKVEVLLMVQYPMLPQCTDSLEPGLLSWHPDVRSAVRKQTCGKLQYVVNQIPETVEVLVSLLKDLVPYLL